MSIIATWRSSRARGEAQAPGSAFLAGAAWPCMACMSACAAGARFVRRLSALDDAAGIDADLTPRIDNVAPITHEAAGFRQKTVRICRGERMARSQIDQLDTSAVEKGVATDEERIGPLPRKICEGRIDLADGAGAENLDLQPYGASSRFHASPAGYQQSRFADAFRRYLPHPAASRHTGPRAYSSGVQAQKGRGPQPPGAGAPSLSVRT